MKSPSTTDGHRPFASYLVGIVLVLVPFHAFLTVWASAGIGHYTALRLWSAVLLLILFVAAAAMTFRDRRLLGHVRTQLVWQLIALYAALTFLLGVIALATGAVHGKALAYGLLSDLRFFAFFFVAAVIAHKQAWLRTRLATACTLAGPSCQHIAVLQYLVLPADVLVHFGYGPATIEPLSTINNNPEYPRVMSTLRGANPLGAYLVVVLGLAGALFVRRYRRLQMASLGVLAAFALLFSFSRSAWLGASVTVAIIAAAAVKTKHTRRVIVSIVAVFALMVAGGLYAAQHNSALQNALFHTEDQSTVSVSSNDRRESALRRGLDDVVAEPFGRGPGTAGPASAYNTGHSTRLAENYYLQIGQELGWVGLVILVSIQALVLARLWHARQDALALGLFAAGIGLVLVNMLSHAWTDDTLAFLWWGLAGIALSKQLCRDGEDAAA